MRDLVKGSGTRGVYRRRQAARRIATDSKCRHPGLSGVVHLILRLRLSAQRHFVIGRGLQPLSANPAPNQHRLQKISAIGPQPHSRNLFPPQHRRIQPLAELLTISTAIKPPTPSASPTRSPTQSPTHTTIIHRKR